MSAWLFTTERLAVRPKCREDAAALHVVFGDPEVMRHVGGPLPTLARTRAFLDQHIAHQETHGFSMWTLVDRVTEDVIGDVGYLTYEHGVEIGWHLRRSAWGHGVATEAARACLVYGVTQLGFRRVSAFVETANTRSVRVIEKLGMRAVRSEAGGGVPSWREYAIEAGVVLERADRRVAADADQ